ncbi:MAG: hypothetical protein KDK12_19450, partial [Rhodobacteraceae bacterium]|nr:hypothetical protein [Paracoccaceae bacterium]
MMPRVAADNAPLPRSTPVGPPATGGDDFGAILARLRSTLAGPPARQDGRNGGTAPPERTPAEAEAPDPSPGGQDPVDPLLPDPSPDDPPPAEGTAVDPSPDDGDPGAGPVDPAPAACSRLPGFEGLAILPDLPEPRTSADTTPQARPAPERPQSQPALPAAIVQLRLSLPMHRVPPAEPQPRAAPPAATPPGMQDIASPAGPPAPLPPSPGREEPVLRPTTGGGPVTAPAPDTPVTTVAPDPTAPLASGPERIAAPAAPGRPDGQAPRTVAL